MPTAADSHGGQPITPDEWPTEAEREYARAQAALAAHHDVEVTSLRVPTESAGPVHCLVAGEESADPLVLLHGINVPAATWIPMLPSLVEEYRVIMPDRPGVGLSGPRTYSSDTLRRDLTAYLCEVFDHFDLDRPSVVASSLGGLQAFLLAIDHDRVGRLCLVGAPAGLTTEFGLLFRLMTMRGFNKLLYWLSYRGDTIADVRQRLENFNVTDSSAITDAFCELLLGHVALPDRIDSERSLARAEASWGRFHPVFDLREEIETLEIPTCFAWGTEDVFWPPEKGRPVAEAMPDAEFHVLEDHGHVPWLEPAEAVSGVLREFLDAP